MHHRFNRTTRSELTVLSINANAWLRDQGMDSKDLPTWSDLPALPPESGPDHSPVFRLPLSYGESVLGLPVMQRIHALVARYDPEGTLNWTFVPAYSVADPDNAPGDVWLVKTRPFPPWAN